VERQVANGHLITGTFTKHEMNKSARSRVLPYVFPVQGEYL
jgi:hypothetical protein